MADLVQKALQTLFQFTLTKTLGGLINVIPHFMDKKMESLRFRILRGISMSVICLTVFYLVMFTCLYYKATLKEAHLKILI